MKLKFKGEVDYNGRAGTFRSGDEREVDDAEAARLLATFPDWFEVVGASTTEPLGETEPGTLRAKAQDAPPVSKPAKGRSK